MGGTDGKKSQHLADLHEHFLADLHEHSSDLHTWLMSKREEQSDKWNQAAQHSRPPLTSHWIRLNTWQSHVACRHVLHVDSGTGPQLPPVRCTIVAALVVFLPQMLHAVSASTDVQDRKNHRLHTIQGSQFVSITIIFHNGLSLSLSPPLCNTTRM